SAESSALMAFFTICTHSTDDVVVVILRHKAFSGLQGGVYVLAIARGAHRAPNHWKRPYASIRWLHDQAAAAAGFPHNHRSLKSH
ncbi:TPA: hypothetical protein ACOEEB_003885, partial [Enterobacter asburiae]